MKPAEEIKIGASVPRAGSVLLQRIAALLLRITGWEIRGEIPDVPKMVIIVAPHTSNWDFVLGLLVIFSLRLKTGWLGKHTIFKKPFRNLLIKLGGIPINRAKPQGIIEQITEAFAREDKFILGLAPEGTRKKVTKWKTGFYHIARKAGAPVLLGGIDYGKKKLEFGPLLYPTDDLDKDMETVKRYYETVKAKYPHLFSLPQ